MELLEKAVEANAAVLQIADNLPLHELPKSELDQLRDAAAARGLALEAGTRSLDPEHLARYIAIAGRINARVLRTVLSESLCGAQQIASAEAAIRQVLPALEGEGVILALENNEAFSASRVRWDHQTNFEPQCGHLPGHCQLAGPARNTADGG